MYPNTTNVRAPKCMSVFCNGFSNLCYIHGVFRLTPSVSHMHYTPPSFEEPGCHSAS